MNDQEDKKKSANEEQPKADEAVRAEPGEVPNESPPATKEPGGSDAGVLVDRPPRRGTIDVGLSCTRHTSTPSSSRATTLPSFSRAISRSPATIASITVKRLAPSDADAATGAGPSTAELPPERGADGSC